MKEGRQLQRVVAATLLFAAVHASPHLAPHLAAAPAQAVAAAQPPVIPERLSDAGFWSLVNEFSEPSGYFRSENFVGNETSLQHVIPELARRVPRGGVYLGVAPDQNFTFLVELRPRIAFIVDIRRQNLLQHLLYKAAMELSANRGEFLSILFSRPVPASVTAGMRVDSLLTAFAGSPPSNALFTQNRNRVLEHLSVTRGFALSSQDSASIAHVHGSFYSAGPAITYNYPGLGGGGGRGGGGMPTYSTMVSEMDLSGVHRSYLASEENYRVLRDMQQRNLIVPLVGDFAGPKALRSVGAWVRERGATVTTFYVSNVEQYLFQGIDDWARFYSNVATLPLDSTSTLIRSAPGNMVASSGGRGWAGARSTMQLSYLNDIVAAFRAGRVVSYTDVLALAR